MIRFIASDLDGTFLAWPESVSDVNRRALAAAADAGVPFVFATGRPVRWLDNLDIFAGQPLAVVSNGAAVMDMSSGQTLHAWELDPGVMAEVCADLRAAMPTIEFALEGGREFAVEPGFMRSAPLEEEPPQEMPLADMLVLDIPRLKLLAKHPGVPTDDFAALAAPIIGDRLQLTVSFMSPDGLLELSAPGVSKRHALEVLAADLGVRPADAAAFGDMPNDLEMLRWVGHPYVMPHAHPTLLAAGLPVLPAEGDDGEAVGRQVLRLLGA